MLEIEEKKVHSIFLFLEIAAVFMTYDSYTLYNAFVVIVQFRWYAIDRHHFWGAFQQVAKS